MTRTISAWRFADFTAAVAEARAEGLEVEITRVAAPYEATAEGPDE